MSPLLATSSIRSAVDVQMALVSSSTMMRSEREREVDQTRARSMPDTVTDGVRQAVVPPASPFLTRGKDMEP